MAQQHRSRARAAVDSWGTRARRARRPRLGALEALEARCLLAAATQLVVATQPPASVVVDHGFGLEIDAEDDNGVLDTSYNGVVTLSFHDNPGSAHLGGNVSVTASGGIAQFTGITIDEVAGGYTLEADGAPSSAGALTPATTDPINVNPLPATQLVVTAPPAGATLGNPFRVTVSAENGNGEVDPTFNGDVTVVLGNNPTGATLGGTLTQTAAGGVATFPDLALDKLGSGYTLQFTTNGLIGAVTPGFEVAPEPATTLALATPPPSNVIAGNPFGFVVDVLNGQNQIDTSYNEAVTVDFASGGNPSGASLLGTTTVNAVGGVATFSGLAIDKGGSGFVLSITSDGLTPVTTGPIDSTVEAATQLVVTTQPPGAVAQGAPFGLTVTAEGAQGHLDPTYSGIVTLSLAGPSGATLGGTITAPLQEGTATFSGLTLDQVGAGYRIQATVPGLPAATSQSIFVTPAPATHLVVTVQPPATIGVASVFGLTVSAENALNEADPNYNGTITIALAGGPTGAVLNGLLTAQAVNGVAEFSGLTLGQVGGGYVIQATGPGLTPGSTDTFTVTDTALVPAAPQLAPASATGLNGITRDNGTPAAPLVFTVSGVVPANGYVQLYDVTNPANPVLLGNLTPATDGMATVTIAGNPGLSDGTYAIAASAVANNTTAVPSGLSDATTIHVETSLHVLSINPSGEFLTSLPSGGIVVTFNHWLTGLVPDKADGSGFANNPFAVILVPSGPDGGARAAQGLPLWGAPTGFDSGDVAMPATLIYHQNGTSATNGTSTITLIPNQPLTTDVYLLSIDGLTDIAGNPLSTATGGPSPVYDSFTFQASAADTAPLEVLSVTANNGSVLVNNNQIPQPDTLAIQFNKDMDPWSINSDSVQLLVQTGPGAYLPIPSAVAYSPSTRAAYLTPQGILAPGSVYVVAVGTSATDDQAFPALGTGLNVPFFTSFSVSGSGVGGHSPLTVTATNPPDGGLWTKAFGYGAVTFSERISLSSLGRYSAMLIPQTGGVTTGDSGYADVPVNAKLAFNPNTNQLIIVPTGLLPNNTVYLFALSGITASNGDPLTVPGGSLPFYATFQLQAPPATTLPTPPLVGSVVGNPTGVQAVIVPHAATARSLSNALPKRPAQALPERHHHHVRPLGTLMK